MTIMMMMMTIQPTGRLSTESQMPIDWMPRVVDLAGGSARLPVPTVSLSSRLGRLFEVQSFRNLSCRC